MGLIARRWTLKVCPVCDYIGRASWCCGAPGTHDQTRTEEVVLMPAADCEGAVAPLEDALGKAADALDVAAAALEEARLPLSAKSARASARLARGQ